jgi:hypothetical protein
VCGHDLAFLWKNGDKARWLPSQRDRFDIERKRPDRRRSKYSAARSWSFPPFPSSSIFCRLLHAGRLLWMHHDQCGFDWKFIEELKPDLVLLAPNERSAFCVPGRSPLNRPAFPEN